METAYAVFDRNVIINSS